MSIDRAPAKYFIIPKKGDAIGEYISGELRFQPHSESRLKHLTDGEVFYHVPNTTGDVMTSIDDFMKNVPRTPEVVGNLVRIIPV